MLKDIDRFQKYIELAKPYSIEIGQNFPDGEIKVFMKYRFNGKYYGNFINIPIDKAESEISEAIMIMKDKFKTQKEIQNSELNESIVNPHKEGLNETDTSKLT